MGCVSQANCIGCDVYGLLYLIYSDHPICFINDISKHGLMYFFILILIGQRCHTKLISDHIIVLFVFLNNFMNMCT
jgi:hypothetical protein